MKKIFFIYMLFFIAAFAWCMPPKPGANFTHDGSLYCNVIENSVYRDNNTKFKAPPRDSNSKFPLTGRPMVLVVLVDFQDYQFNDKTHGCKSDAETHGKVYYENLLETGTGLTMTKFYSDMSNERMNLRFKITGPYKASGSYKNYGENDKWGDDKGVRELAVEILSSYKSDIEEAIGSDDVTGGNIIFIHSGPGEENGGVDTNHIWSCSAELSSEMLIKDKKYNRFIIGPEYVIGNGKTEASIGVFCHEFGHVLGLPDLYDTSYATAGIGNWSLMGAGSWGSDKSGNDPAPLMNWEKATLGWIPETVIDVSATPQQVNFKNANDAAELLRINLDADQYLVFDGKKKASGTDMFVPEDGLLITQIHEGVYKDRMRSNTINYGVSAVHAVSIVEAQSDCYKTNGLGWLWQGSDNKYRTTTAACFRSDTATSVGPMVNGKPVAARHPLIIVLFKTMFTSAAIVGVISAVWYGRKKLCFALAGAVTMIFLCLACDAGGGGISGPSTNDSGPNTNYYENTSNVHSKTGLSGIRIYDIECNSDGSGSFMVVREN